MALTYTGTSWTLAVFGNNALTQNLFVISNGIASRKDVYVKRLCIYNDATAALTAVQPSVILSRCTSVSGGVIQGKGNFDTTKTSDENITVRGALLNSVPITATAGDRIFSRFTQRMHTAVEQQSDRGICVMKTVSDEDLILHPGENFLLQVVSAATTSNPVTNNFYVLCEWEEWDIATFSISGTVTLSGSPVSGAKIIVIEADDTSMTNAVLREIITTPAGGTWSSTIRTGKVGAAFVQYQNGGTLYTALGSPYLE